jgi:hypothetical protein
MGNRILIAQVLSVGCAAAAFALSGCAANAPMTMNPPAAQGWKEIAPSELKIAPAKPEASTPKQKQSAQPPVDPAHAESRTPQERAEARAADPKDASGAIIIKVPVAGTGVKP